MSESNAVEQLGQQIYAAVMDQIAGMGERLPLSQSVETIKTVYGGEGGVNDKEPVTVYERPELTINRARVLAEAFAMRKERSLAAFAKRHPGEAIAWHENWPISVLHNPRESIYKLSQRGYPGVAPASPDSTHKT